MVIELEKKCRRCGDVQAAVEYPMKLVKSGDRYREYGSRICRTCINWKARCEVYKKYGMTEEEYNMMAKECEICGSVANLAIDHDHDTGEVRGRLCRNCNVGIGHFGESVVKMKAAIQYLQERAGHKAKSSSMYQGGIKEI